MCGYGCYPHSTCSHSFIYAACALHVGHCVWLCGPYCVPLHVFHTCYTSCMLREHHIYSVLFHSLYPVICCLHITCLFHVLYVHIMFASDVHADASHILYPNCAVCPVWCVRVGVLASDSSAQASRVQVAIQTLDENDNAPQLAEPYDTFVCDSAAPGQVSS